MPTRLLRDGFLDSETIAKLSEGAESLFVRLLLVVDDFGRCDARPGFIKSRCYPVHDQRLTIKEVQKRLTELARTKDVQGESLVSLYMVRGRWYLVINKFQQRLRAKHSKWPEPPDGLVQKSLSLPEESGPAAAELPDDSPLANGLEPPQQPEQPAPDPDPAPPPVLPPRARAHAIAARAVDYLNAKAGTKYRHIEGTLRLPIARVLEGASEADLMAVIDLKIAQAVKGEFDRKYLRPETLFNATKFASYIGQVAAEPPAAAGPAPKVRVEAWAEDPAAKVELCQLHATGIAPDVVAKQAARDYGRMIAGRGLRTMSVNVPGQPGAVFSIEELQR